MRFRAILICLLFLTLTTKTKATNAYEPIHGGEAEITLNLVDRNEHEVAIFQQSHFNLGNYRSDVILHYIFTGIKKIIEW